MRVAIVLGTRPEIIKMAPLIKEFQRRNSDFFILHTGQHYSYNLDKVFFQQLELPHPSYNLEVGSGSHAEETAKMLVGIEKVLLEEKPDIVLVEGDTNSVFAAAVAAVKLHIKVGHVEAGLRSYDRSMPEEINRTLTDHCSDYLFAPTEKAKGILLGEGIPEERVFVTGNTIVDSIYQNIELARERSQALSRLNLSPGKYFLVTLHRQENVDNPARFASIIEGLDNVATQFQSLVVYTIHPRSRKMMNTFKLQPKGLRLVDPLDYLAFLHLESYARLILTDSGGVQEEACVLGVPCVTLRDNTERPETIEVGANILAGATAGKILECARFMLNKERQWQNPYGDGRAGERILSVITGGGNG